MPPPDPTQARFAEGAAAEAEKHLAQLEAENSAALRAEQERTAAAERRASEDNVRAAARLRRGGHRERCALPSACPADAADT